MSKVILTAKDAAERLGVSYVIAAGLLSHLEESGKAVVVEKRFHPSGKGKPTRVFSVDQEVTLNFGSVAETTETETVAETTETETVAETTETETVAETTAVAAATDRLREAV